MRGEENEGSGVRGEGLLNFQLQTPNFQLYTLYSLLFTIYYYGYPD
jgi:hypothetical protein